MGTMEGRDMWSTKLLQGECHEQATVTVDVGSGTAQGLLRAQEGEASSGGRTGRSLSLVAAASRRPVPALLGRSVSSSTGREVRAHSGTQSRQHSMSGG